VHLLVDLLNIRISTCNVIVSSDIYCTHDAPEVVTCFNQLFALSFILHHSAWNVWWMNCTETVSPRK